MPRSSTQATPARATSAARRCGRSTRTTIRLRIPWPPRASVDEESRVVHVRILLTLSLAGAAALAALAAFAGGGGKFVDPLDAPARPTQFTTSTHLSAIARAGNRLVSVGVRGLIVMSDDEGKSWRQAASPVSSDLVAVRFVTPSRGWASGHDGVILSTEDGGNRWVKQLDGRMAALLLADHFDKLARAGDANAARLRKEVARNY